MQDGKYTLFGIQFGLGEISALAAIVGILIAPAALVVALATLYTRIKHRRLDEIKDRLGDPAAREEEYQRLSAKTAHESYFAAIRRINVWADGFFGDNPEQRRYGHFTWPAFVRCLQIALFYPLLFLLIGWAFGAPGKFGPLDLLPADISLSWRWFNIVLLLLFTLFVYVVFHSFDKIIEIVFKKVDRFILRRTNLTRG